MVALSGNFVISANVVVADSVFKRFKGLMGRKSLVDGESLLIKNCPSVHSFFMKIPIDVVSISSDWTVLGVEVLRPWRIAKHYKGTAHILEMAAGSARAAATMLPAGAAPAPA